MFRRDSCAWYVLRFVLVLLLFWCGMQWVRGRLFPYRRFLPLPPVHTIPATPAPSGRHAQTLSAFAGNSACVGAAARSAPGRMPPPDACL